MGRETPKQEKPGSKLLLNFNCCVNVCGRCWLFLDLIINSPFLLQICLSFYQEKNKQASWFTNKTERFYWEQWYINLHVAQHSKIPSGKTHQHKTLVDREGTLNCCLYDFNIFNSSGLSGVSSFYLASPFCAENALEDRNIRRTSLETCLREVLFQVIKFVNERKDHVPAIPSPDCGVIFPYEITIPR